MKHMYGYIFKSYNVFFISLQFQIWLAPPGALYRDVDITKYVYIYRICICVGNNTIVL